MCCCLHSYIILCNPPPTPPPPPPPGHTCKILPLHDTIAASDIIWQLDAPFEDLLFLAVLWDNEACLSRPLHRQLVSDGGTEESVMEEEWR